MLYVATLDFPLPGGPRIITRTFITLAAATMTETHDGSNKKTSDGKFG
jgi:hypothetical protein